MENQSALSHDFLVCDLDDSLIRTDILFNQILQLAKTRPFLLLPMLTRLLVDRAGVKSQLAQLTSVRVSELPYRSQVVNLLVEAQRQGVSTVLASATNQSIVKDVADHVGCFDTAAGSTELKNLKGEAKLDWIQKHVGGKTFSYIGDSEADLPIWRASQEVFIVNPTKPLLAAVHSMNKKVHVFSDQQSPWPLIFKQMRVHQWVKNVLLFVPVLAAHRIHHLDETFKAFLGAVSFSFVASMVYVVNDMLDVDNDRRHPTKRLRPFASGKLPLRLGFVLVPLLFMLSVGAGWRLPLEFFLVTSFYLFLNLYYSMRLKEVVMMDVVVLATFYTLRLVAGAAATGVMISHWLLSFSLFFFFGLAMVKRYTELMRVVGQSAQSLHGRGYSGIDKLPVFTMGVVSSMISVAILVLYFASPEVSASYRNVEVLWVLAALLIFWIGRVWMLAHRGLLDDDPVVFAFKDRASWMTFLACGIVLGLSLITF